MELNAPLFLKIFKIPNSAGKPTVDETDWTGEIKNTIHK
jgi:hypothetical protein